MHSQWHYRSLLAILNSRARLRRLVSRVSSRGLALNGWSMKLTGCTRNFSRNGPRLATSSRKEKLCRLSGTPVSSWLPRVASLCENASYAPLGLSHFPPAPRASALGCILVQTGHIVYKTDRGHTLQFWSAQRRHA